MGEVGSARYEPALLPPCPSIRVLSYSNCQEIQYAICNAARSSLGLSLELCTRWWKWSCKLAYWHITYWHILAYWKDYISKILISVSLCSSQHNLGAIYSAAALVSNDLVPLFSAVALCSCHCKCGPVWSWILLYCTQFAHCRIKK